MLNRASGRGGGGGRGGKGGRGTGGGRGGGRGGLRRDFDAPTQGAWGVPSDAMEYDDGESLAIGTRGLSLGEEDDEELSCSTWMRCRTGQGS